MDSATVGWKYCDREMAGEEEVRLADVEVTGESTRLGLQRTKAICEGGGTD